MQRSVLSSQVWRSISLAGALAFAGATLTAPAVAQPTSPAPAMKPTAGPQAPPSAATEKPKPPDRKTTKAAQTAFDAGSKAFEAQDYATALAEFQKANALIPTAVAQYWIAVSTDKGDPNATQARATIASYEAFLALPDVDKAGSEKIEASRARITELRAGLDGTVSLSTNPAGAAITIDGAPDPAKTPAILTLKPGSHRITLSLPGYEDQHLDVTVAGDQQTQHALELTLIPPPPPPPPAPPPPPPPPLEEPEEERSLVPAYVTLGVAGASAVVGTIFGIKALGAKSDFDDAPTADNADSVERNALIADMAFGVAVTLGVTGIVLLTSDEPAAEEAKSRGRRTAQRRLELVPYAGPTGGGARAELVF